MPWTADVRDALYCQVRDYGVRSKPEVSMYSFGQPRVGNGPFAKEYGRPFTSHFNPSWKWPAITAPALHVEALLLDQNYRPPLFFS